MGEAFPDERTCDPSPDPVFWISENKKGGAMTTDEKPRTNKKGGRPRIAVEDRRSEKLAAAVTPETRETFRKISEAAGMTTSDYLRDVIVAFLEARKGGQA
jgi:hypothetical protein